MALFISAFVLNAVLTVVFCGSESVILNSTRSVSNPVSKNIKHGAIRSSTGSTPVSKLNLDPISPHSRGHPNISPYTDLYLSAKPENRQEHGKEQHSKKNLNLRQDLYSVETRTNKNEEENHFKDKKLKGKWLKRHWHNLLSKLKRKMRSQKAPNSDLEDGSYEVTYKNKNFNWIDKKNDPNSGLPQDLEDGPYDVTDKNKKFDWIAKNRKQNHWARRHWHNLLSKLKSKLRPNESPNSVLPQDLEDGSYDVTDKNKKFDLIDKNWKENWARRHWQNLLSKLRGKMEPQVPPNSIPVRDLGDGSYEETDNRQKLDLTVNQRKKNWIRTFFQKLLSNLGIYMRPDKVKDTVLHQDVEDGHNGTDSDQKSDMTDHKQKEYWINRIWQKVLSSYPGIKRMLEAAFNYIFSQGVGDPYIEAGPGKFGTTKRPQETTKTATQQPTSHGMYNPYDPTGQPLLSEYEPMYRPKKLTWQHPPTYGGYRPRYDVIGHPPLVNGFMARNTGFHRPQWMIGNNLPSYIYPENDDDPTPYV